MSFDLDDAERALKSKDYPAAFAALMTLARNGHEQALIRLSDMAAQQQVQEADMPVLLDVLTKESKTNNHHATLALAVIHWKSPHAARDHAKALSLLQACCNHQLTEGYAALAKFLMTEGKDSEVAKQTDLVKLLTQGMEHGSIEACFLLGREYSTGEHCPKDDHRAYKHLFMAAKLGHTESKKYVHMMEGLKHKGAFDAAMQDAVDSISEMESRMVRFV